MKRTPKNRPWRVLEAQGHEVRIYLNHQHGADRYVVAWYTADGRQKLTRTKRDEAIAEGDAALRRLVAYGPDARVIDRGTADYLDRLRAVDDLRVLVPQVEAAARVLADSGLTIEEACRMVAQVDGVPAAPRSTRGGTVRIHRTRTSAGATRGARERTPV